ncbi:hypothetical protein FBQ85_28665 [Cytophagia bacterium CHB2]|nr:hypothetical protein [Cytophagia bacterium CHB2]
MISNLLAIVNELDTHQPVKSRLFLPSQILNTSRLGKPQNVEHAYMDELSLPYSKQQRLPLKLDIDTPILHKNRPELREICDHGFTEWVLAAPPLMFRSCAQIQHCPALSKFRNALIASLPEMREEGRKRRCSAIAAKWFGLNEKQFLA